MIIKFGKSILHFIVFCDVSRFVVKLSILFLGLMSRIPEPCGVRGEGDFRL